MAGLYFQPIDDPFLMYRISFILSLGLLTLCYQSHAGAVRDGSLNGYSNNSVIIIHWQSDDETGVRKVEIERQIGVDGAFVTLHEIPLKGSNQSYEYIDDSAFRIAGNLYNYRIKVTYTSQIQPVFYGPISVVHIVNSVRRTWGSIKAMFR
jgi:hypothetical protein